MKRATSLILKSIQVFLLTFGTFSFFFFLLPFSALKSLFDSLAPDKNLEIFTLDFYQFAAPIFFGAGLFFLLLFFIPYLFPKKSHEHTRSFLSSLRSLPARFRQDARQSWHLARLDITGNRDWVILLFFMVLGGFLRVLLLNKPLTHDEAYTYIGFTSRGFWAVISDYHLPNNHILYSIFVFLSVQLFGNAPWVIRFPALLAGVLLISAVFLAARAYFNRETALLTSGIVAIFPVFMLYGTSARGYAQLALLSVLLWWLATLLLKRKNLFIWFLFILIAAAGFYTIPIMLYPFASIMAWLFIRYLTGTYSPAYKKGQLLKALFFAGLTVVTLFLLLYTPVFIRTGARSVFYSDTIQFVQEPTFELLKNSITARSIRSWAEWHTGMPALVRQMTLIGFLLSLAFHRLITKKWGSYLLVSVSVILGITLLQRTFAWTRVWFFFAPIYFSFAAAGWVFLIQKILGKRPRATLGLLSLFWLAALFFIAAWFNTPTQAMRELRGDPAALERGMIYLRDRVEKEDALVASSYETPAMQYYAAYYGIPLEKTYPADNIFKSLYAIVTSPDATVAETLHSGTSDRVDLDAAQLIYRDEDLRIYKVPIVVFYDE